MTKLASLGRAVMAVAATVVFVVAAYSPCSAQYASASLFPLNTLERYLGPIIPKCGITSSFRSEVGAGIATAVLQGAKITGSRGDTFDLVRYADIDEDPQRLDIYANLRLWRFGIHADYWNFDTRSTVRNLNKLDLTGLILGGDVDLVQLEWLAMGVRTDFYFLDPRFQGTLRSPGGGYHQVGSDRVYQESSYGPRGTPVVKFDIKGDRPITVGPYLRYVPPEILGWPLHLEAYLKLPIKGTSLTSFGGALVFRPQIYRFDIAARLYFEDTRLKFTSGAVPFEPAVASILPQDWKLDAEWYLYGIDFAVYF